ncbi:hypothetical protein [Clostridium sp. D33t1_170424_F3]|uniref:hypothetical protein n=1 Tax=Clostridium sp. D33t1_170424_F3 TaxID=2787099 RepID=UPI0018AC57F4|nr:hypothetical protein [Clostridium sp. D33t1_170424_F3]
MKKIKCLAIVVLLLCGIICNSVPTYATSNVDEEWQSSIGEDYYVLDKRDLLLDDGDDVVCNGQSISESSFGENSLEANALIDDGSTTIYEMNESGEVITENSNLKIYPNPDVKITKVTLNNTDENETNINPFSLSKSTLSESETGIHNLKLVKAGSPTTPPEKSKYFQVADIADQIENKISTVSENMPDLYVYFWPTAELDDYYDPVTKTHPSHITIPCYLRITNIGDAVAPIVHLDPVKVDGHDLIPKDQQEVAEYYNLQPGDALEGIIPISALLIGEGTHFIQQSVNFSISANDRNWADNSAEFGLIFKDGIDVVAKHIKLEDDSIYFRANTTARFETLFHNMGKKRSGRVNVKVKYENDLVLNYTTDSGYDYTKGGRITFNTLAHYKIDKAKFTLEYTTANDVIPSNNYSDFTCRIDYGLHLFKAKWRDARHLTVAIGPSPMRYLTEELGLTESQVLSAFSKWNNISRNVNITAYETNVEEDESADVRVLLVELEPDSATNAYADSKHYNSTYFESDGYIYIGINTAEKGREQMTSYSTNRKISVLTHEMGHLLGLAHGFDDWERLDFDKREGRTQDDDCFDYSIMYKYNNTDALRTVRITDHDEDSLLYKYGN